MKTLWMLFLLIIQNLGYGQNCAELQNLSLPGNRLKDLPQDSIEKTGSLYLKVANHADLNGIERLKCLKKLTIKGLNNSFISFPNTFSQLSNLEDLEIADAGGLHWTELFRLIEDLPQLKRLIIQSSGLSEIPPSVNLPSSLEIIEFPGNNLTIFPEVLFKLKKLRILNLEANQLKILPAEILEFIHLEELHLGMNKLERIPSEIGKLKVLRVLDLFGSELSELPQSIENLSQLTYLNLAYNRLKNIPSSVYKLTQLKVLDLSRNRIRKIPPGISLLKNLESLLLEGNLLISLPSELCLLSKLRTMDVSNNQLTDLPGDLKKMDAFDVRGNNFKTEPKLFIFYKSKVDSIRQKYDSTVIVYMQLKTEIQAFDQTYEKLLKQFPENKDSLTEQYQMLAIKIYQYNGLDYIKTENKMEFPPLLIPSYPSLTLDFKQDLDKQHSSYSIALPSLYKK